MIRFFNLIDMDIYYFFVYKVVCIIFRGKENIFENGFVFVGFNFYFCFNFLRINFYFIGL